MARITWTTVALAAFLLASQARAQGGVGAQLDAAKAKAGEAGAQAKAQAASTEAATKAEGAGTSESARAGDFS